MNAIQTDHASNKVVLPLISELFSILKSHEGHSCKPVLSAQQFSQCFLGLSFQLAGCVRCFKFAMFALLGSSFQELQTSNYALLACLCIPMLAYACFCLFLLASACLCLLLFAYACLCLPMLASACLCLPMLAYACLCLPMLAYACLCLLNDATNSNTE